MTRWVPVPGLEESYEVSDAGEVRSKTRIIRVESPRFQSGFCDKLLRGKMMKCHPDRNGYLYVNLRCDGKSVRWYVHRLVLQAFEGDGPEGYEVRHLDGDKTNNHISNLRYGTRSENMLDRVRHGTHHYAKRTHCRQGHPYTPENTYVRVRGGATSRVCRTCTQIRLAQRDRRTLVQN